MADLDLSLSDALTDAIPQTGPESLVERDFVAQLESESFDDQIGETVGKTDYTPLLDNDDPRADESTALENGDQEVKGVQKPGGKLIAGGQTSATRPEPQGEVRPFSADQQALAADFLSASMADHCDPLGSRMGPAQVMDSGLAGAFLVDITDFSQPGDIGGNVEVGAAPLPGERPSSIAEPQQPTAMLGSDAPKEQSPMLPEPQAPRSPLDLPAGPLGDCWPAQTGCLTTDLPFTPSVSTVISRHAGDLAISPDDPPDSWHNRESVAYAGSDEREGDGSERKQKKKKKRRQKDEGTYEHPNFQDQGKDTPPTEEFFHRIGPRRDQGGEGGWEEQLGKSGGRGKRGKSRKKLPEEWGVMGDPFIPSSTPTTQIQEEVMVELGTSSQAHMDTSFAGIDISPWSKECYSEESLIPLPLSQDLFSATAANVSPLVLNSDLKATATPFTMPSPTNNTMLGSFPMAPCPDDPFATSCQDLLMDSENANLGNTTEAFTPSFSLRNVGGNDDSGVSEHKDSLSESGLLSVHNENTSEFSPASQPSPGVSTKGSQGEVVASAPPLSPSDASWLQNNSHLSSNSEPFDFSTPGHCLPLGLDFDTPSPAPLRSPKTTAQEFQSKEPKNSKSAQKQAKKMHSPSSASDSVKSPPQASEDVSPSSPPSSNPLGVPGSGLNPSAKPFFPSFADSPDEPAAVSTSAPVIEVKSDIIDETEKQEGKKEDSIKKEDLFAPLDKDEKKVEKMENIGSDTPAKMENMVEEENPKEKEKEKGTEKEEGKVKVTENVESVQKPEKEDTLKKVEVSADRMEQIQGEHTAQTMGTVGKMDKNESPKAGKIEENKTVEKHDETEMRDSKEQNLNTVETAPEKEPTSVMLDTALDKPEKKADSETKHKADIEETKENEKAAADRKTEDDKLEKPPEKKTQGKNSPKKLLEKKDDKKDKTAKTDGAGEKAKKASVSKDLPSADKKTKPAAGVTKLSAAAKTRPSSTTASGALTMAPTKRPTTSTTFTSDSKKTPITKAPSTSTVGPKRPLTNRPSSTTTTTTTTTTRDIKPRTTIEKRPLVPKASTATSDKTSSVITKNGTATTATSRTTTPVRTAASTRSLTATTATAKKPLGTTSTHKPASKPDSKPGEEKKSSTLKTTAADSMKPKTSTSRSSALTGTTAASRPRSALTKPGTTLPCTTGIAPEKKPLLSRAPRATSSTTATTLTTSSRTTSLRTTSRPSTAPGPDVRNARSKIGSTDNMKHQPGGGKVSSTSQNRGIASKETSQSKVQILNKKVDLSKVTSKCGSKDNIKHKPGGGDVKIESRKMSVKEKAQSKVDSMENVGQTPGGGNNKAEVAQETTDGSGTPLNGTLAPTLGCEPEQAGSPAHELKEGTPCDSEGPREPQGLDSSIPETN
ncbi:uncharacterized protein LOC143007003 isoform X2 [Genypterus blacodes]|uniref:uncharacterized protein LOC143007003 isoform X2 n=1 Tax=Genypterus blacodes TaxID=154954 RepID=UPI003F76698D